MPRSSPMLDLMLALPEQLLAGYDSGEHCRSRAARGGPRLVAVLGMGGSGISGGLLAGLVADSAPVPVLCCRDYDLSAAVDRRSLAVAISYSGNTEETLSAFEAALDRGCPVTVVSSGGRLSEEAHRRGLPVAAVPTGLPPRAALGFLFGALLALGRQSGVSPVGRREVVAAARLLVARRDVWRRKARNLARRIGDGLPVVYATDRLTEPVAERWRCQLNENAKLLCHSSVLPEHNHNEIVGLGAPAAAAGSHLFALVAASTHPRTRLRLRQLPAVARGAFRGVTVLEAEGDTRLEQMMSLVMLGDLLSYELAVARGVDPVPVARIDELKRRMARG